ncbi:MAG: DEAD/DEAH box helicase, partial [Gammaproteobacteria bacterium]|nr:DEAD/DEAH box helicase [Acidobacteriota bacterium]MYK69886.1 DEAD/DEAH box helicase [Gammaproteobacteria bacterium]
MPVRPPRKKMGKIESTCRPFRTAGRPYAQDSWEHRLMSVKPKPFQRATIRAARRAFADPAGSRRFLVADEVGLGKTIVASGIVEEMSRARKEPLRVFYVCSNLTVADQNIRRLVSFVPAHDRHNAVARVDRPSLIPTRELPTHSAVQVFALTPDTALPSRRHRRREGRAEERAFGFALLDATLPETISGLYRALRLSVGHHRFSGLVRYYRHGLQNRKIATAGFRLAFRRALRTELGLRPGQHLPPRIRSLVDTSQNLELVAAVRSAIAVAALQQARPDLVIFDEFHRFRDLLEEAPNTEDHVTRNEVLSRTRDAAASRVLQ